MTWRMYSISIPRKCGGEFLAGALRSAFAPHSTVQENYNVYKKGI